jgi:hypothetical protein
MDIHDLAQLEKQFDATMQHCRHLSFFIEQLLALPEETRDAKLVHLKLAEHKQMSAELRRLGAQLRECRAAVINLPVGVWPMAGALWVQSVLVCVCVHLHHIE